MQTVTEEYFCETEVKNSKFLCFVMPFKNFEKRLTELKALHPKARHHITAYRRLNQFDQVIEQGSDDGEPKGCAGKPTLNVMRGSDLINCAVITVRYFGGIKLGTGGMVRAYSLAVKNVIEVAELKLYEIKRALSVETPYAQSNQLEYLLEQEGVEIVSKAFLEDRIRFEILVTAEQLTHLTQESVLHRNFSII